MRIYPLGKRSCDVSHIHTTERRPFSHNLINTDVFGRIYAIDDQVGILFENEMAVEVITDAATSSHDDGPAVQ